MVRLSCSTNLLTFAEQIFYNQASNTCSFLIVTLGTWMSFIKCFMKKMRGSVSFEREIIILFSNNIKDILKIHLLFQVLLLCHRVCICIHRVCTQKWRVYLKNQCWNLPFALSFLKIYKKLHQNKFKSATKDDTVF